MISNGTLLPPVLELNYCLLPFPGLFWSNKSLLLDHNSSLLTLIKTALTSHPSPSNLTPLYLLYHQHGYKFLLIIHLKFDVLHAVTDAWVPSFFL